MLATRATRPAKFNETMRRVRLEKLSAKKYWPARRSQASGQRQPCPGGFSAATASIAMDDEMSSAFRLASGCVRSSNGQNLPVVSIVGMTGGSARHPRRDEQRRQVAIRVSRTGNQVSSKR